MFGLSFWGFGRYVKRMTVHRRDLLVGGSLAAAGAWVAPAIVRADVAAAATSPPCDPPVNLALSGTASQISTAWGGSASRGNDGNTAGNWSAGTTFHTASAANAWWQVVLPAAAVITQVVLYNRTDSCCVTRAQNVSVTIDGTSYGVVPSTTGSWTSASLAISNVSGQTIRVTNGKTDYFHLAEVQVFGCPP